MAGEWRETTLWEVAEYINGRATKPSEVCSNGVPVIKIAELNRGITDETDYIPSEAVEDKHRVREGDLLFAWSGSVGVYKYNGPPAALNQHIFRVLAKEGIDQGFLRYLLQSCLPVFRAHVEDKKTTMGHVTIRDLQRIRIRVPPLPEQRAIAHILGTLDDKIELNRRMSETLEAIARAIFKSWFVDFDPVRAKMEGRWQRGQSQPGLPAHLYDLFPDRLVASELGEIPEGWGVKKIGDVITRLSVGKKYEQKTVSSKGCIPVLDQGKSGIIGYHNDEPGVVATTDSPVVVFANHTCYMRIISFSFSTIQNVIPFIGKDVSTIWVYYATLGKQSFVEYKGHWPDFVIHDIVIPPKNLTEQFAKLVHYQLKLIWENEHESRTLAALRDALLPKLIRGEIRVKDAERMVGRRV